MSEFFDACECQQRCEHGYFYGVIWPSTFCHAEGTPRLLLVSKMTTDLNCPLKVSSANTQPFLQRL